MPLNYPSNSNYDDLMGINNSLSKMLRAAMPVESLGISESISKMMASVKPQLLSEGLFASLKMPAYDFAGLTSLSNMAGLAKLNKQFTGLAELGSRLAVPSLVLDQLATWQRVEQRVAASFPALGYYEAAAVSPWLTQTRSLQGVLAGLQVQLAEAESGETNEALTDDEPVWRADFTSLTQQFSTFAATEAATASDVTAMRAQLRDFSGLMVGLLASMQSDIQQQRTEIQQQSGEIQKLRAALNSPFEKALKVIAIISIFIGLIGLLMAIEDRMNRIPAALPPAAAPAPTAGSRLATRQELQVLQSDVNDTLFSLARRLQQVRTTTTAVRLKAKPRSKATGLGELPPNTAVVMQQQQGKWVLIVAQEPGKAPRQGWVLKKYLAKATR